MPEDGKRDSLLSVDDDKEASMHLDPSGKLTTVCIISVLAACLSSFQFGFNLTVINTPQVNIERCFKISGTATWSVVVAIYIAGGLVGSTLAGPAADKFGRIRAFIMVTPFMVIGSLLQAFSQHVVMFIIGRFTVGLAAGAATLIVPMYIAEIAPIKFRGALGSCNQMSITVALLLALLLAFKFVDADSTKCHEGWRFMVGFPVIMSGVHLVSLMFAVESPLWLLSKGRAERAEINLRKLRGVQDVSEEMKEMEQAQREVDSAPSVKYKDLMSGNLGRAMLAGVLFMFAQQWSGIGFVLQFSTSIFQKVLCNPPTEGCQAALDATAGIGAVNVVFSLFAMALIERAGRRILMLVGCLGMSASLLTLGVAANVHESSTSDYISVASIFVFNIFFAFSAGPIGWLICGDILPSYVAPVGMPILIGTNWAFNFIATITFLPLESALKNNVFWIFTAVNAFVFVVVYLRIPETRGKQPEAVIQELQYPVVCQPARSSGSALYSD